MTTHINTKTYEPTPSRHVAFLGLGVMGYPMAGHLARAGHQVTVYNRTTTKSIAWCTEFTPAGVVKHAKTPMEAARGAEFVFCCVGNDDDLRQVTLGADGAFAGMAPGAVFVDHTTASASVARELYGAAKNLGLHFVDAPVSGGQAGAQNGLLTVMCGGDAAAFDTAHPVAMAFSKAVTRTGESGSGQLAKMVNQICIAGLVQVLAEAIAFGQQAGLVDARDLSVNAFKVVTERGTTYLMGRVTKREADRATEIARGTNGVLKVVRMLELISENELRVLQPVPTQAPKPVL